MAVIQLETAPREITKKGARTIRQEGRVPCELYGGAGKNISISIDASALSALLREAGETAVVELDIAGKKEATILQDVVFHPVTGAFVHVDFLRIDMEKPIVMAVPLEFVGISPAIKELGGTLVRSCSEVEVECLPQDVPRFIEVDLTALVDFDTVLSVEHLKIEKGVKILLEEGRAIAVANKPRTDEELAALNEEVSEDVDSVEATAEKEEVEGEEGDKKEGGETK